MESGVCTTCNEPKTPFTCGRCEKAVCKKCVQKLEKASFPLLVPVPVELSHKNYCGNCYVECVGPALEKYQATVERAKAVFVFHVGLGEETRRMSRSEKPIKIEGCTDKTEAMLRLAFCTVQAGFNALIDVDVSAVKVRNAGFQTAKWNASGVPLTLDPAIYNKKDQPKLKR